MPSNIKPSIICKLNWSNMNKWNTAGCAEMLGCLIRLTFSDRMSQCPLESPRVPSSSLISQSTACTSQSWRNQMGRLAKALQLKQYSAAWSVQSINVSKNGIDWSSSIDDMLELLCQLVIPCSVSENEAKETRMRIKIVKVLGNQWSGLTRAP